MKSTLLAATGVRRIGLTGILSVLLFAFFESSALALQQDGFGWNFEHTNNPEYIHKSINGAKLYIEKNYLTDSEQTEIANLIENGIIRVKAYLGHDSAFNNDTEITYRIRRGIFISMIRGRDIDLSFVKEKQTPYIHETVHAIAGYNWQARWLSEGLAVYLNDVLNGWPAFPNKGENPDDLSRQWLKTGAHSEVLSFDPKYAIPTLDAAAQISRGAYFVFSASLVKYIEHQYGKTALLRLYQGEECRVVLEREFEQLKTEWMSSLGFKPDKRL